MSGSFSALNHSEERKKNVIDSHNTYRERERNTFNTLTQNVCIIWILYLLFLLHLYRYTYIFTVSSKLIMSLTKHFRTTNKQTNSSSSILVCWFIFIREFLCFHIILFCLFLFILLFNQNSRLFFFLHINTPFLFLSISPSLTPSSCFKCLPRNFTFFADFFRYIRMCVCALVRMFNHNLTITHTNTKTNGMLNLSKPKIVR